MIAGRGGSRQPGRAPIGGLIDSLTAIMAKKRQKVLSRLEYTGEPRGGRSLVG